MKPASHRQGFCLDLTTWVVGPTTAVGLCALRLSREIAQHVRKRGWELEIFSRRTITAELRERLAQQLGFENAAEVQWASRWRRYRAAFVGQHFISFDHRLPRVSGARRVCVVHDAWTLRNNPWQDQTFQRRQRPKVLQALSRADVIFCPSTVVARELSAFHRQATTQIHVLPWAAMVSGSVDHDAFTEPQLLMIGTWELRKNHAWMFRLARELGPKWRWALVGGEGFGSDELLGRLSELETEGIRVERLARLSESEMREAYRNAFAVLCPSFEEGFGLTVLEAMSLGRPVWASKIASHQEIGGDTIPYFDPLGSDVVQVADQIMELSRNALEYQNRIYRAQRRAEMFSWSACGDQFISKVLG